MATQQELLAQRQQRAIQQAKAQGDEAAARDMAASTDPSVAAQQGERYAPGTNIPGQTYHGRQVAAASNTPQPTPEIHVGGVPEQSLQSQSKLKPLKSYADAKRLYDTLSMLNPGELTDRERAQYEQGMAALEFFKENSAHLRPQAEPEGYELDTRIQRGPKPLPETWDYKYQGQTLTRPKGMGGVLGMDTEQKYYPRMDELPTDHPLRLKADMAEEGVNFNRALPFYQRVKAAWASEVPAQKEAVLRSIVDNVPDDLPAFAYDSRIDDFIALQPVEGQQDKYEYVSLDGVGFQWSDFANVLDPAELGSLIGSIAGTVGVNPTTATFMRAAGGPAAGGAMGRNFGEALKVLNHFRTTGNAPTYEELAQLGWNSTLLELVSSVIGEGAARGVMALNRIGQDVGQTALGKVTSSESGADIAATNARIEQFQEDVAVIRDVTGSKDYTPTAAEVTGNLHTLERQNTYLRTASSATKQALEIVQAKSDAVTTKYIDQVFGGNSRFYDDRYGIIKRANDAITDSNHVVVRTEDGSIIFTNKTSPNRHGDMVVRERGGEWQIQNVELPDSMRGQGYGTDLYRAAIIEGRSRGKNLQSDTFVSDDAMRVWDRLDGSDEAGTLIRNPNVIRDVHPQTGASGWVSTDTRPVIGVAEKQPYTPLLLAEFMQPGQTAGGKMMANKEFSRFLRSPGAIEKGTVIKEIASNPYWRQNMKEAVLDDFNRSVNVKGKFSIKAFEQWKSETGHMLENIFPPDEMIKMRRNPSYLREAVEASRTQTELFRTSLSRELKVGDRSPVFTDPTGRALFNQFKSMEQPQRQRVMSILRNSDAHHNVENLFREELRDKLITWSTSRGTTPGRAETLQKFLKDNGSMIRDVLGTQYDRDLNIIGRMIERKATRRAISGTRAEANPLLLAAFRVVWGPLSRKQRGLTAARRWQVRSQGERAVEIITDPEKMRTLVQYAEAPIATRVGTQAALRLGLLDFIPGVENMDPANPDDRLRIAGLLQDQEVALGDL